MTRVSRWLLTTSVHRRTSVLRPVERPEDRVTPTARPTAATWVATGAGAGDTPVVRVADAVTGHDRLRLVPFAAFTGGVRVAVSGQLATHHLPAAERVAQANR